MPAEYLDCVLNLTGYDQASLSVAGRDYSGRPALDEALQQRLLEAELDPTQYGRLLFSALLPAKDDLLAGYREGQAIAGHEEKLLRFRLHIAGAAPRNLHSFHWELLFDPKKKRALSRSRNTAFSRYMSVPIESGELISEKPKLLVALSSPTNLMQYKLPEIDYRELEQSLKNALRPLDGIVAYEFLDGPVTPERISERLLHGAFHALHIHAHGLLQADTATACLVLEDENRAVRCVPEQLFSEVCAGVQNLRLITLIACQSGVQPRERALSGLGPALVELGIPAVVGMQRSIRIDSAASFTQHFYLNLARTGRVDVATNEARLQVYLRTPKSSAWGTPVLFMRLKDGKLWNSQAEKHRPLAIVSHPTGAEVAWPPILDRIESGNFVPILGPGIYRGLLPSNEEIAARWAEEYQYPLDGLMRRKLPSVSHYLEKKMGYCFPHDTLPRLLVDELLERQKVNERDNLRRLGLSKVISRIAEQHFDRDEGEPHRILADLPVLTYVTTNYNSFMTAALEWSGRKPRKEYCRWRDDAENDESYRHLAGTIDEPLVFHLYGHDEAPTSQVLTEDDYLDFLRSIASDFDHCIPLGLKAKLTKSMLLFLGYDVSDLNCRVLFRGLVKQLRDIRRGRIALLQLDPEKFDPEKEAEVRNFMEKCCKYSDIEVYWGSERAFLKELHGHWVARNG